MKMNPKSITFITLMGLLTTFTLAGSIWLVLVIAGPNSITRVDIIPPGNTLLEAVSAFFVVFIGGALWGLGLALLTNGDMQSLVKRGALTWGITTFIISSVLGLSLGLVFRYAGLIPLSYHYYFLALTIPPVGLDTGITARMVAGKLILPDLKNRVGLIVGIASALGFLTAALILQFGLGWEVGKPVPGKYEMLTILFWCTVGAALAGGLTLGMELVKWRELNYIPIQAAINGTDYSHPRQGSGTG